MILYLLAAIAFIYIVVTVFMILSSEMRDLAREE